MGSTRLPGKTLIPISGKPLLAHVCDRARRSKSIERVIVATTTHPEDDVIERFAGGYGVDIFRGSSEDVLDRYYRCASHFKLDCIVRLTADDPFKDPSIIDEIVRTFVDARGEWDYVSNLIQASYPEGMEVEVFSFAALECAWNCAELKTEREHVTPFLWMHPERFRLCNVLSPVDLSKFRWTLDTERDLAFTRAVYAELYQGDSFSMEKMLELLYRRPDLAELNSGGIRYESFWKSYSAETQGMVQGG